MGNRRSKERKDKKKDRAFSPVPSLIRRRNLGSGQMSLGFLALLAQHRTTALEARLAMSIQIRGDASMAKIVGPAVPQSGPDQIAFP